MNRIQGPRGREYPDHNPQSVVLLGMGPSVQDFMADTMTQELKPSFADEIWGVNMTVHCFRVHLCFWMDDLEQQAKLVPHRLMPTKNLKVLFDPERMAPLVSMGGGDRLCGLIDMAQNCEPLIQTEKYEFIIEEFKSFLNGPLRNISYDSIKSMMALVDEEKKGAIPDESRSLKGLIEVLDSTGIPVITAHRRPDFVKNSFDYPLDEIADLAVKHFGKVYLSNGVAMAIAYAMWKGVKRMKIYGCDFTYPNRNFAETGRACVEAWMAKADTVGMQIELPPHTSLLDSAGDIGIYGYAEQPPVFLSDGRVMQYKPSEKSSDGSVQFYRPDIVGKHAGVTNEFSKANEIPDIADAHANGSGFGADGHAADDGWRESKELDSLDVPQAAAP